MSGIRKNSRQQLRLLLVVVTILVGTALWGPATGQTATWRSAATTRLQTVVTSVSELETGKLLVAHRRLRDPNFAETVVLLLEYSQDGAMGVVINRPTTVPLATVLSEVEALKTRQEFVYLGGPVGREQMLLLARTAQKPKDVKQILNNVYLIPSQKTLQQIMENTDSSLNLRAYIGYAGWAPKQLDSEVERGDWHIHAADATLVFDTPADQLWQKLITPSEFEWTHNLQNNERPAYSLY